MVLWLFVNTSNPVAREEANNFVPFRGPRERNEKVYLAYYGKAVHFSTNKKGDLTFQREDGM
jgi:hypothetical protein